MSSPPPDVGSKGPQPASLARVNSTPNQDQHPNYVSLFSSTPAASLTRSLPHGVGADILVLQSASTSISGNSHDLRNVLYTAYAERGLPPRTRLHVTTCCENAAVVARDVLFLTLILDAGNGVGDAALWELFHNLFISDACLAVMTAQAGKLFELTTSGGLEAWKSNEYGTRLEFRDEQDLRIVRAVWKQYISYAANDSATRETLSANLQQSRVRLHAEIGTDLDKVLPLLGLRSAAPLPLASTDIVPRAYRQFWDCGILSSSRGREHGKDVKVVSSSEKDAGGQHCANPLVAATLLSPFSTERSDVSKSSVLNYTSNPLLAYHLGTALARLAQGSPLSLSGQDKGDDKYGHVLEAIKLQFSTWTDAYRELVAKDGMILEFAVKEPLRFLHSLAGEDHSATEATIKARQSTVHFDVIDTTSLADDHGFLDLLVAVRPFLKNNVLSIIHMEALKRPPSGLSYRQNLNHLMCGDAVLNALVLGLSPVEYWTNASVESCIDDVLIRGSLEDSSLPYGMLQNHFRSSWRLADYFCCRASNSSADIVERIVMSTASVVRLMVNVLDGMISRDLASTRTPDGAVAVLANRALTRIRSFVLMCLLNVRTDWPTAMSLFREALPSTTIASTLPTFHERFRAGLEDFAQEVQHKSNQERVQSSGQILSHSVEIALECEQQGTFEVLARIVLEGRTAEHLTSGNDAPIRIQQLSPFACNIIIGNNEIGISRLVVTFPIPVLASKIKTCIDQEGGTVELTAQSLDPLGFEDFSELILPARLTSGYTRKTPVGLNNHSVNLDSLPIISVDNESESDRKATSWLATLTSQQFSARERRERDFAHEDDTQPMSAKLNLKESIFTIFMLASGLQGGSTGLFTLSHPDKGNQILIFVRALLLDADVGSVVADAAVLPITRELLDSGELETFLLVLRELEACVIDVSDEELVLWKRVLPGLVERCRTWEHQPGCEYNRPSSDSEEAATIPLSVEPEETFLCSCGNGKLPERYMGGLPEWENKAARHAVRVAISPLFAVPWVEDIMDLELVRSAGGVEGMVAGSRDRCKCCGATDRREASGETADSSTAGSKGRPLMRCTRCKDATYCSLECQKKDWKKHRMECRAPGQEI
ncbi:DUF4470 domain-containing protein [Microdochium nivale]|nr:DUF4470 domain-containing protein [Microdochium nivale]